jgi:hypothetical protein
VAGLTAAILLLVVAGFAGVTWNYWRAEASRRWPAPHFLVQR